MKKTLPFLLMLLTVVFSACSNDDDDAFKVSFENAEYSLTNGSIEVRITAQNAPAASTEIPVTFGGTAVMDEDYTVSTTKYVVGGSNAVQVITVTAKNNFTEDKTITMSLSGAKTGKNATATIALGVQDKRLYSFSQKAYVLGNELEVEFNLLNAKDGSRYVADNDIEIEFGIDEELTTAEGGVNFEFETTKATIAKGSNTCKIKLYGEELTEGKNIIVIKPLVTEAEGFIAGAFPTATITMVGSYASDLLGTWTMKEMTTDKTYFNDTWSGMLTEEQLAGLPEYNKEDTFTFSGDGSGDGYKLTTSLKSTLKNYFNESSDFTIDKEATYKYGWLDKRTMQLLKLNNVNRYFSATETSTDKEAYIGVRNVTDEETGETLLEIYVIDYNSKSFFYPVFDEWYMYNDEKPTATMSGVSLYFKLKKAE